MFHAWFFRASRFRGARSKVLGVALLGVAFLGACAESDRTPVSSCAPACGGFETCCSGADGVGVCRATTNDPLNCGGCGIACPSGRCLSEACVVGDGGPPRPDGSSGGMCTPTCSSAQRCCGTSCVNRSVPAGTEGRSDTSFANCAGCGVGCDPMRATACSTPVGMSGTPQCLCGDWPQCAPGNICMQESGVYRCVMDPACGDPPVTCGPGEICNAGTCSCGGGSACTGGQACCGGACVDVTSDTNNCGACGNVCPPSGPSCSGGSCGCGSGPPCAAPMPAPMGLPGGSLGETCCSGTCVANSTSNCGGCGVMCAADEDCIVASGGLPFPGLPMGEGVCCGTSIPIIGGFCSGGFPMGDGGLPGLDAGLPFP